MSFPCVIIHVCVCVCLRVFVCVLARLCFFLCGVITSCPTLRGVHVYPAQSLSCHCGSRASVITMATNRRSKPASSSSKCSQFSILRSVSQVTAEPNFNFLSALNCVFFNAYRFLGQTHKKLKVFRITFQVMSDCFQSTKSSLP